MLKHFFGLPFILFFLTAKLYGQVAANRPVAPIAVLTGDGKIVGVLKDSLTHDPLGFSTISLFSGKDKSKPIDGVLSDENGKFVFKNLLVGKYTLKISALGYSEKVMEAGDVSKKSRVLELKDILLNQDVKQLNEVVVTGQAALIEERVDRMIYNAEKDVTSAGGDATEVLRKVPLLTVDLDGNVELRGNPNIKVLINNKPSSILAASVSDALKQIPANTIKSIEVITSPSAKYDAEGSGGIINIITKKNNLEGYSLSVDLGGGNRGTGLALNGSLRTEKIGFTLGGFGRYFYNPTRTALTQIRSDKQFFQLGDARDNSVYARYNFGFDYDFRKNQIISGGVRFGARNFNRNNNLLITTLTDTDGLESIETRRVSTKIPSLNWDFNLDYLYIIKKGDELSISTLYSNNTQNSSFTNERLLDNLTSFFKNTNDNLNQELTVQIDYLKTLTQNQILEVGAKVIHRDVNSNYDNILNDSFLETGGLDYTQDIGGGYVSYTYQTKNKYAFKAGLRYEHTELDATTFEGDSRTALSLSSYDNFFPSVNVSKNFKSGLSLKLGYSQRLQRPGLTELNPNLNMSNPQNYTRGNPDLDPAFTNNIELSLSTAIKKLYINVGVFNRFSNNSINQYTSIDPELNNVLVTEYLNIGVQRTYGSNLSLNLSLNNKWSVNLGGEVFYDTYSLDKDYISNLYETKKGLGAQGRMMSHWSLDKGWKIEAFGFLRGSRVAPLGRIGGFGMYAIGFRKVFWKEKASFGLSVQNFLSDYQRIKSYQRANDFAQTSYDFRYNRGVSFNFSYKIGKMGVDTFRKKKARGVKNDDVIESGEGSGGRS